MKAKPVEFTVDCTLEHYVMVAVDLHEVFLHMQLTNWYEEHGFLAEEFSDIYWYLLDRWGYHMFLVAGGNVEI